MTRKEFEMEYRQWHLPLGMYVLRITSDVDASQDIVQNVFAEVWRRICEGEEISNLKSYLYRAAHNAALNWVRQDSRFVHNFPSDFGGAHSDFGGAPSDFNGAGYNFDGAPSDSHNYPADFDNISEEDIDTSERDARLWRIIDSLPDRCREIFLLSKRDGLSNAEIAEELGVSIKTVENQITKAYKRLRPGKGLNIAPVFFLPFL